MNRKSCVALMVVAALGFGAVLSASGAEENLDQLVADANKAVAVAEAAVEEARVAIQSGKQLIAKIPEDSEVMGEVAGMLKQIKENWTLAVSALDGAKASAAKISAASSFEVAQDYKLLSTVNAGVALSGAKVVQIGLLFVDAAANNKAEALDIIRVAMQDSLAASSQVQFNYERVKKLVAKKYSK